VDDYPSESWAVGGMDLVDRARSVGTVGTPSTGLGFHSRLGHHRHRGGFV